MKQNNFCCLFDKREGLGNCFYHFVLISKRVIQLYQLSTSRWVYCHSVLHRKSFFPRVGNLYLVRSLQSLLAPPSGNGLQRNCVCNLSRNVLFFAGKLCERARLSRALWARPGDARLPVQVQTSLRALLPRDVSFQKLPNIKFSFGSRELSVRWCTWPFLCGSCWHVIKKDWNEAAAHFCVFVSCFAASSCLSRTEETLLLYHHWQQVLRKAVVPFLQS